AARPPAALPLSLHDALPILLQLVELGPIRLHERVPCFREARVDRERAPAQILELVEVRLVPREKIAMLRFELGEGALACVENLIDRKSTRLNSSHVKISYAV